MLNVCIKLIKLSSSKFYTSIVPSSSCGNAERRTQKSSAEAGLWEQPMKKCTHSQENVKNDINKLLQFYINILLIYDNIGI